MHINTYPIHIQCAILYEPYDNCTRLDCQYGPCFWNPPLDTSKCVTPGSATGQLDEGIPWFSSALQQKLSRYPKSTLHCMLPMQSCPGLNSIFSTKRRPPSPQRDQKCVMTLPNKHKKTAQMSNFFPLPHTPNSPLPCTIALLIPKRVT